MKRYNMTLMYSVDGKKLLFCRRVKNPYKWKLNFPGGKVEAGESSLDAAYRELEEETGIGRDSVTSLHRVMDFTYYASGRLVEVFVCRMTEDKDVRQEKDGNPLIWIDVDADFDDTNIFAGDGNIKHCIMIARRYLIDGEHNEG